MTWYAMILVVAIICISLIPIIQGGTQYMENRGWGDNMRHCNTPTWEKIEYNTTYIYYKLIPNQCNF